MNWKTIILYGVVFGVAFSIFAVVLFPGNRAAKRLARTLNRAMDTGSDIQWQMGIGNLRPSLPIGFRCSDVVLSLGPDITIVPESVKATFSFLSLFKGEKKVRIRSEIYQGQVNGDLILNQWDPVSLSSFSFQAQGLHFKDFTYQTPLATLVMTGEAGADYTGKKKEAGQTRAREVQKAVTPVMTQDRGTITFKNVGIEIKDSWLNVIKLSKIDFTDARIAFTLKGDRVIIDQCLGKGSIIHVRLFGDIRLKFPLAQTRLNLKGVILPESPYLANFANQARIKAVARNISQKGITFHVKGTLDNPEVGL